MMKKYEFTGKTLTTDRAVVLKQIRAIRAFGNIEAGEVGGWIQREENLSHVGNAWVSGNARVSGKAWVSGKARVSGDAQVYGDARVSGDAQVSDNARVYGDAWLSGDAQVSDNARVYGDAWLSDNARVSGKAWVSGKARVSGDAQVYGDARVYGDAWLSDNAWVSDTRDYLYISPIGSASAPLMLFRAKGGAVVARGCFRGGIDAFAQRVEEVHGKSVYGDEYRALLPLLRLRAAAFAPVPDEDE